MPIENIPAKAVITTSITFVLLLNLIFNIYLTILKKIQKYYIQLYYFVQVIISRPVDINFSLMIQKQNKKNIIKQKVCVLCFLFAKFEMIFANFENSWYDSGSQIETCVIIKVFILIKEHRFLPVSQLISKTNHFNFHIILFQRNFRMLNSQRHVFLRKVKHIQNGRLRATVLTMMDGIYHFYNGLTFMYDFLFSSNPMIVSSP